jgi:hypothetical protein
VVNSVTVKLSKKGINGFVGYILKLPVDQKRPKKFYIFILILLKENVLERQPLLWSEKLLPSRSICYTTKGYLSFVKSLINVK